MFRAAFNGKFLDEVHSAEVNDAALAARPFGNFFREATRGLGTRNQNGYYDSYG
jgi:hypothetical protein